MESDGADARRWYLTSSALLSGGDLAIPRDGSAIGQSLRTAVLPLWNAYSFFSLYANIDGYRAKTATKPTALLDRYILAKTAELVENLQARLDVYDLPGAYAVVPSFIEALNNWYIRRSRARFWREGLDADKGDAYDTLYTVLTITCRALAPLLPFVTERIYRNLSGEESVHLRDWPELEGVQDPELVRNMDCIREVCASAMSLREAKHLRVRLPLRTLTVTHPRHAELAEYSVLVAEEANVKNVQFESNALSLADRQLKINAKIGQRIGGKIKVVLAAAKSGEWTLRSDGNVEIAGMVLQPGDFTLRLVAKDGLDSATFDSGAGMVVLDTRPDAALISEGLARDFVRLVQQSRKDGKLNVTDRINVYAGVPEDVANAIQTHADFVRKETLTREIELGADIPAGAHRFDYDLDGRALTIAVARVE